MKQPITKKQIEDLQKLNSTVKIIDIRSAEDFEKQHVPDAVNIPAEILQNKLEIFSKEDSIVCVCNHGHGRSQSAAELVYNNGFENTFYLEGGTAGWFETPNP